MTLKLIPFSIQLSRSRVSLFILGFQWGHRECGLGFSLHRVEYPDRHDWQLYLSAWRASRTWVVRHVPDHYKLVCNYCGADVWKHNLYCTGCLDDVPYEETTRIELKPKTYGN